MTMKKMVKSLFVTVVSCLALTTISGCVSYHKEVGSDYLVRPKPTGDVKYITKYQVDRKRYPELGKHLFFLVYSSFLKENSVS